MESGTVVVHKHTTVTISHGLRGRLSVTRVLSSVFMHRVEVHSVSGDTLRR